MSGTIVVGVDGSWGSVRALRWALTAAAERDCDVEVVTAWPHTGPVFVREVPGHHSDARQRARTAQAEAVRDALAAAPGDVPVTTVLENARPEAALTRHARGNRLLVLGATGDGLDDELAERCREQVDCPVAVIEPATGEVQVFEPLLVRAPG